MLGGTSGSTDAAQARSNALAALAADPQIESVDPVFGDPESNQPVYVGNEILARLKPGVTPESVFGAANMGNVRLLPGTSDQYIRTMANMMAGDLLNEANFLASNLNVSWAQVNFVALAQTAQAVIPNDPFFVEQWDGAGHLFTADTWNHRIRRIDAVTNIVTTVARTGVSGFADGPGASAQFRSPHDVAVDFAGNIYVTDLGNHRIRRIDGATNSVTTIGGTGAGGDHREWRTRSLGHV